MDEKFDADFWKKLSGDDRRQLLRQLLDAERDPAARPGISWRWDLLLALIILGCVVLAAWIGYLVVSLPVYYRSGSWRGAWVGFDIAELAAFAATGWAAWKRRQLLIIFLIVLATLLLCDAWFDVVLDARTAGFLVSLLSALLVEVPIAVLALFIARRLLKLTTGQLIKYEGWHGPVPPLWKIPLFGSQDGTPFERLIKAAKSDILGEDTATTSAEGASVEGAGPESASAEGASAEGASAESASAERASAGGSAGGADDRR
jgi:hypothetical protein